MTSNSENFFDWMELIRLVLEFGKGVAWPIAAIIIGLMFKFEVRQLLGRMTRLGPTGAEFKPGDQQPPDGSATGSNLSELRPVRGVQRTQLIEQIERSLRVHLNAYDESERLDAAMVALATSKLETHFSLVYNQIFGSQIKALKLLNQRNGVIPIDEARRFFDDVKSTQPPLADWTFEQYVKFLKDVKFIEEKDGQVSLTEMGKTFLLFLTQYRLLEDKPL